MKQMCVYVQVASIAVKTLTVTELNLKSFKNRNIVFLTSENYSRIGKRYFQK